MAISYILHTIVWGKHHTEKLLAYCLPTLLAPGNLPSISKSGTTKNCFRIYTTAADSISIINSPVFKKLKEIIKTEIFYIDSLDVSDKTVKWTITSRETIISAKGTDTAFIFIYPDCVYSDGLLANACRKIMEGKRAVLVGVSLTPEEHIGPVLDDRYDNFNCSITIFPREIVRTNLERLDPGHSPDMVFTPWPAYMRWRVGKEKWEGWLTRTFHPLPIIIYPVSDDILPDVWSQESIDGGGFLARACPDVESIYSAEDSDFGMICGVEFPEHTVAHPEIEECPKVTLIDLAFWAKHWSNSHQRVLLKAKYRAHYCGFSEHWEEVEKESDKIVENILAWVELLEKDPEAVQHLVEFSAANSAMLSAHKHLGNINGYSIVLYRDRYYVVSEDIYHHLHLKFDLLTDESIERLTSVDKLLVLRHKEDIRLEIKNIETRAFENIISTDYYLSLACLYRDLGLYLLATEQVLNGLKLNSCDMRLMDIFKDIDSEVKQKIAAGLIS